jgi:hypothetical protein
MAADASMERLNYVLGLQAVARLVIQLNQSLAALNSLYVGGGLSGTFTDAEMAANPVTKHMVALDVGTFTANLNTVQAALTPAIIQNMAKAVGTPVGLPQ